MNRRTRLATCCLLLTVGCGANEDEAESTGALRAETALDAGLTAPGTLPLDASTAPQGIRGPVNGRHGSTPFSATLSVTEFVENEGSVYAVARLTDVRGALQPSAVAALEAVEIAGPVTFGPQVRPQVIVPGDAGMGGLAATCDVLYLLLSPLRLDVLGAVLDLDRVTLDVHAEPGPENLLGRLLCDVAALLDPAAPMGGPLPMNLEQVVGLLNQVLTNVRKGG